MQNNLIRYSKIITKQKREFVLLQGSGCVWKKCLFCDYYEDISDDPFKVNKQVLETVTGEFGVLDIINSGSAFELDNQTVDLIYEIAVKKKIHTLWFEAHWLYHKRLDELRSKFKGIQVKFRVGIETFDVKTRDKWQKGIPQDVKPEDIAEYYDGCCLLVCVEGQTKQMILNDIEIADRLFSCCSINLFVENSKGLKRDNHLAKWFCNEVAPMYKNNDKFEILIKNTDLGVG